jgi:D-alanyl-D-alanine carboxypeptidase/D-alanyl-D-alanine-endopeptidase (penicillin-binding protein 4)
VLPRCNKDSLNLAAEAFVKTISAENTTGRINGEWHHGHVLIGRYLNTLGVPDAEFTLDDGSGLSPKNKLTANALSKVLLSMYKSDKWKLYKASLAVGGVDGTLDGRFTESKYKGKIVGKSGYISGVRTLSGVATTPRGDYIFSILTRGGDVRTRQAINDIAEAIIDNIK